MGDITLPSGVTLSGVGGSGSSTDNALPRFDGITGLLIQNSGVILDDSDNMSGVQSITLTVPDEGNTVGLAVNQNDVTNNPVAASIVNAGTGDGQFIGQNGNGIALNIESLAVTDVIKINNPATVNGSILNISNANALAFGNIAKFESNSSSTFDRDLVSITNNHSSALNVNALAIQNDGAGDADAGVLIKFNNTPAANTTEAITSFTAGAVLQGYFKMAHAGGTVAVPFYSLPTS